MIGVFVQLNTESPKAHSNPVGYVIDGNGCWEWAGGHTAQGYGLFTRDGQHILAHRFVYEGEHGPLPKGWHLHHRCRNRACVNPVHLVPLTAREHVLLEDSASSRNAAKTHCPHGHPYDAENTITDNRGQRHCRTCARVWSRRGYLARRVLRGHWQKRKTHCPQGHPYDEANTYVTPLGHRGCRICREKHWRAHYYGQKS